VLSEVIAATCVTRDTNLLLISGTRLPKQDFRIKY